MNTRQRAFTMVELLVTIMVILLVSVMLVPFLGGLGKDRTEAAANQLQGYLSLAKQEAMKSHRDTALFIIPPGEFITDTRLVLFQLKEGGNGKLAAGWQVIPGSLGMEMPEGIKIVNAKNQEYFHIWFNAQGALADDCRVDNMTIRIGPRSQESRMRTIQYSIGRQTGGLLRFNNKINYID